LDLSIRWEQQAFLKAAQCLRFFFDLKSAKGSEQVESSKLQGPESLTIAFSCRSENNQIITSEVFIDTKSNSPKILSYQELSFEEKEIMPSVLLNIMAKSDYVSVSSFDQTSPGLRTLMSLAKVGIPVALSFKAAKILAPNRSDWQKHFVAGAIISGVTVLTTESILRTYARNRGYSFSDTQITILSSLAGLLGSIAAGAAKEGYDHFSGRGTPEFKDAVYTAAGGAMVSFTVFIPLDRLFRSRRNRPRAI